MTPEEYQVSFCATATKQAHATGILRSDVIVTFIQLDMYRYKCIPGFSESHRVPRMPIPMLKPAACSN